MDYVKYVKSNQGVDTEVVISSVLNAYILMDATGCFGCQCAKEANL